MKRSLYFTIFLLSIAGLALENSLTRIFSITMWYHYAFMAISVAMLGMSTGAVKVYVSDFASKSKEEIDDIVAKYCRYFTLFTVLSLFTLLSIPFVPRSTGIGIFSMALIYGIAAVPFYFQGVAVALLLTTKYMDKVNSLYAADLAGAAIGSILFFIMLNATDAVTFIIFLSAAGVVSSWVITKRKTDLVIALIIVIVSLFNSFNKTFRIEWTKVDEGVQTARIESHIEWESWTPFSRITVYPYSDIGFGWGISKKMMDKFPTYKIEQKGLQIDSAAATVITKNQYSPEGLLHLRYDITNIAHYLFTDAKVGVIGVGGGRDVLSALSFNQKEIWGIEINDKIIKAVTEVYKDYTYPIAEMDNVHIVIDEARSFFERHDMKFDIIQASLIDSWAATTSGAFVLTENSLYTVDAWKTFYNRLSDNGAITMSRWYYEKRPGELLRLVNLAYEMLLEVGVKDPSKHILLSTVNFFTAEGVVFNDFGTGTIVVSKKPLKNNIIDRFMSINEQYGFNSVLAAGKEKPSQFTKLVSKKHREKFISEYMLDISAPTDDNPFFFNMLKPGALLSDNNIENEGPLSTNLMAVKNLLFLLGIVILLSIFLIIVPILSKLKTGSKKSLFNSYSLYFVSIGTGFMLIEISLIQKFAIFLGHPTYSILVVLFTVLFFSGLGSFLSSRVKEKFGVQGLFSALLIIGLILGTVNMFFLPSFSSWGITTRIIYSFITMAMIGTMLGMPFPTGFSMIPKEKKELAPWLWGVNGAASVVSSVLAVVISIFYGISATFFTGIFFYVLAFVSGMIMSRNNK